MLLAGQGAYMNTFGTHRFESGGGKKAWAERIDFLDGMNNDEVEALSLIRVREAVREEEWGMSSGWLRRGLPKE